MDADDIVELFRNFGPVTVRRLFGGAGIYCEDIIIGLLFDGEIYLKADDTTIAQFEREGSKPFVYTRARSPSKIDRPVMSYWRMPARLYDDPEELAGWARDALAAARKPKARKKKAPKRPAAKNSAPKKKPAVKSASKLSKKKQAR